MKFFKSLGLLALASLTEASQVIKRASLQQVTNFGANTSGTKMYIYVPNKLAAKPPIIVAVHYCSGTAQAYYSGTPYAQLAEQYGFIVIYPESPYSGTCWDVSSTAALTHNGGADSNSIANMVTYTLQKYSGDASKVFVTGTSSGAMMTNVLAATYPEMFAAATVYSGVPAGCFYTGTIQGWNSTCSQGQSIHTSAEWASTVYAMYPGYTGPRPRMLVFHGSADTTLYPQNWNETMKQWAGVFGYTYGAPQQTLARTPSSAYTKYVYGPNLVGVYGTGIGHSVPVMGDQDLAWFGITGGGAGSTTSVVPGGPTTTVAPGTTLATTTKPATTTTVPAGGGGGGANCAAKWGQCGGQGWTGAQCCQAGSTCKASNQWYSQCL